MAELLSSGRLIDAILLLVAVEAMGLVALWVATGRGIAPRHLLPNLFAGAALLLALRLVIAGAEWPAVCATLAAAGIASLVDLAMRWQRPRR